MRSAFYSLVLAVALAVPAAAQRASDAPGRMPAVAPVPLTPGALFTAQTLRFSQSYEMSYSGGAGGSLGLGVYTGSMQWQPSARLAGRVDVGVAHSPFGTGAVQSSLGLEGGQPSVYLRNAEVAYRPTENSVLHLSVQQSPYGAYASPYGAYGREFGADPFSRTTRYRAQWGSGESDHLFFRDGTAGDGQ